MLSAARAADNAVAVKAWSFILSLLLMLSDEGMSSDESDEGEDGSNRYRCRTLPWRRKVDNIMELIDSATAKNGSLFRKKGPSPSLRVRPALDGEGHVSKRDPPKEYPLVLIDKTWLEKQDAGQRHFLKLKQTSFDFQEHIEETALD